MSPSIIELMGRSLREVPAADIAARATLPALIPGAAYRAVDGANSGEATVRKEFSVKPGETIDLGDILIARPRRRD